MERTGLNVETVGPASASDARGATFCAGCGSAIELARCVSCGAATAPGGFRVERILHESDHARVYLARGPDGRHVALKELLFARAPDAATLDAFAREAELLAQLSHPAIPRFVASFREGEGPGTRLYLAQEYVEGETLQALLQRRRVDAGEAAELARKLFEILRYLHGRSPPLVHRDIKPANVLIRAGGSLALVDFGCAREVAPRGTHRATVAGTFGYMPPEALGGSLDRTADLYGVGATVLHLLARKPPEELLFHPGQLDLGTHVNASPGMVAFLARLTAARPADRFASVEEAELALRDLRELGGAAERVVAPPAPRAALPRRNRFGIAMAALALGASIAFGVTASVVAKRIADAVGTQKPVPRGKHGTLSLSPGALSPIYLDGERVGWGSTMVPLDRPVGSVRISNSFQLRYTVEGDEVAIEIMPQRRYHFVVDGEDVGARSSFSLGTAEVSVQRKRPGNNKPRSPLRLRYLPPVP